MTKFIIPFLAFLAPIVLLIAARIYHAKKEPLENFAWGFFIFAFLAGWGIALGVLGWNLGWWG
jgi:hypothetical protein